MRLATPPIDPAGTEVWVGENLGGLYSGPLGRSPVFRGGQQCADRALEGFDVAGYAATRNEVWPPARRGASMLSPYIRHGLLHLQRVWEAVGDGPDRDTRKFRDELLWQEYARHLYARMGVATARPLRFRPRIVEGAAEAWPDGMACIRATVGELERDGWLVNQTRMWLASQWTVRHGRPWREGEEHFFRHLLDGSRAANRLGWQWTIGALTGKEYGFSRWQVEKRAPGVCGSCRLQDDCPIEEWPPDENRPAVDASLGIREDSDPGTTAGPEVVEGDTEPDAVWLTAESLGDADPALAANPELPALFVFDEALLHRLQLSAKRLVFLAETLAELGERRPVEVYRGDPVAIVAARRAAVTFAPVPGFRSRLRRAGVARLHPWPWLVLPGSGPVASFSAWRKTVPANE